MNRAQLYIIDGIIVSLILLFIFWAVGYWCNALLGMRFELHSCLEGALAIGSAGVLSMVRYIVDSLANSPKGVPPIKAIIDTVIKEDENDKGTISK